MCIRGESVYPLQSASLSRARHRPELMKQCHDECGWKMRTIMSIFPSTLFEGFCVSSFDEIKKDGKRDGGQAAIIRSELSNGRASPVSDTNIRPGKKGEQIRKRRCKASFSYAPQHEDELELKVGDVIEIITEVRLNVLSFV
ncbi:hypothetical protein XENORESO_020707 [Xenotaenia resolanae]|uniref:SH3 domain-containing protein n=1 Tax=Xenotaenia resolanae TaxID=208358 RepID=A0ABV0WKQ3_9TELE